MTYQNMWARMAIQARVHHRHRAPMLYSDWYISQVTKPTPNRQPAFKVSQYHRGKRASDSRLTPTQVTLSYHDQARHRVREAEHCRPHAFHDAASRDHRVEAAAGRERRHRRLRFQQLALVERDHPGGEQPGCPVMISSSEKARLAPTAPPE
ncbi:hypothetical protein GCM10010095_21570 [Streptomyces anthocyanicus]|nr:hypothetical protein GCM10010095_21570 [Streptomyces anthocyanicus]